MAFMKGKPLVTKVAALARYGLLPGAMVAALVYSPPNSSSLSTNRASAATTN
uniref:Uncharacterized protein n=1 Tax=Lotus japonicus TaxID=34305 RepID=I3SGU8_LOTJA|nr:unknown [Lotus japonicus]